MQNRTDEIWESLAPLVEERGKSDLTKTIENFGANAERLLSDLRTALRSCDEQAAAHRKNSEKGETAFIALSFLDTSILTGTNDLRIDFYDDTFIEDIAEASAYFPYQHLIPIYQESVEAICKEARKKYIRFMDYERDALACKYRDYVLYKMVMTTCSLCLLHPEMADFWATLTVSNDCVFTFGRLQNNQQLYLRAPHPKKAEIT